MDKERHNFLFGAAAREPGKRQFKPNAAFFDQLQLIAADGADDDEEDDDVIFPSPNVSRSSSDNEQQKEEGDEEEGEQSSTNDNGEDDETGGNSSDDEDSGDGEEEQQQQQGKPWKSKRQKGEAAANAVKTNAGNDGVVQLNHQLCAVCLDLRPADLCGELIQCDRCAIFVHELCYGVVAADAGAAAVVAVAPENKGEDGQRPTAPDEGGDEDAPSSAVQQHGQEQNCSSASADPNKKPCTTVAAFDGGPSLLASSPPVPVVAGAAATSSAPTSAAPDAQSVASSSASTEPWFCEPCLFGVREVPHCELCPSRYGAFKRAAAVAAGAGCAGWVHVQCAAFTLGVRFADPAALSAVTWRDIDARTFGRKPCAGCASSGGAAPRQLIARTGVTVRCDAGMCRHFYHVTCAQRLGLLIDTSARCSTVAVPSLLHHHHQQHNHSPADVGYLYCEKHAPRDASVPRMRIAYANFVEAEERRMAQWNRRVCVALDARQARKRAAQLRDYQQRMQRLLLLPVSAVGECHGGDGDTTTSMASGSTAPTQRRAKLLHTNARLLDAFAEKHELLGLDGAQFAEEFSAVPAAHLPSNLAPAFSKTFISYAEHRDLVGLPGENARLGLLNRQLAQRQQHQREMEQRMDELRKLCTDAQHTRAEQHRLLERCRAVTAKLVPSADGTAAIASSSMLLLLTINTASHVDDGIHGSPAAAGGDGLMMMNATTAPAPSSAVTAAVAPFLPEAKCAANHHHHRHKANAIIVNVNNINRSSHHRKKVAAPKRKRSSKSPGNISAVAFHHQHLLSSSSSLSTAATHPKNLSEAAAKTNNNNNSGLVAAVAIGSAQNDGQPLVPPPPLQCHKCKKTTDAHLLAYCDTCKCHYHIGCLDPPLAKMPAKSKFSRFECSDCACPSDTDDDEGGGDEAKRVPKRADSAAAGGMVPKDGESSKMSSSSLPTAAAAVDEHWELLQNRPKRQRRTPRIE
ncbi:hypothetical protein niasHS_016319 [Heterodera schachtii]|uniref:PHD-type domain-containing protein n=1 Tax=Heterodera schachtii TaxID=97005 RepID=A0ABD2HTD1_HETSC